MLMVIEDKTTRFERSRRSTPVIAIGLCATLSLCCVQRSSARLPMNEHAEVTAVVLTYIPNAMQDHFEDGAFASYDATRLRLVKPENLAGRELSIYHNRPEPANSLWRGTGRRIVFVIDEGSLGGGGL